MNQEELENMLRKAAPNGKLSCEAARRIAGENGIAVRVIGETCNRLQIKITACELGCF